MTEAKAGAHAPRPPPFTSLAGTQASPGTSQPCQARRCSPAQLLPTRRHGPTLGARAGHDARWPWLRASPHGGQLAPPDAPQGAGVPVWWPGPCGGQPQAGTAGQGPRTQGRGPGREQAGGHLGAECPTQAQPVLGCPLRPRAAAAETGASPAVGWAGSEAPVRALGTPPPGVSPRQLCRQARGSSTREGPGVSLLGVRSCWHGSPGRCCAGPVVTGAPRPGGDLHVPAASLLREWGVAPPPPGGAAVATRGQASGRRAGSVFLPQAPAGLGPWVPCPPRVHPGPRESRCDAAAAAVAMRAWQAPLPSRPKSLSTAWAAGDPAAHSDPGQ